MKDLGLSQATLDEIRMVLGRRFEIESCMVFGSRAKGTFRPGSDIDLALTGSAVTHETIVEVSYLLNQESTLPYQFDVLQYNAVDNPALLEHINRVGCIIYDVSQSPAGAK